MNALNDAIYDKLSSVSAITDEVGTNIFRGLAPPSATYPMVRFYKVGGGENVETPHEVFDGRYWIVAESIADPNESERLAGLIGTAFQREKDTLTVSGWNSVSVFIRDHIEQDFLDPNDGKHIWLSGRMAYIRLDK
jgi:hypothetical protein